MKIKDVVFVYQLKGDEALRWHSRKHKHPEANYEFHYMLQGEGSFKNEDISHSIIPGSLFFTLPGKTHSVNPKSLTHPVSYYAVLFELGPTETEIANLLKKHFSPYKRFSIGTNYRFFFEEIKEKSESTNLLHQQSANHQMLSFLYDKAAGIESSHLGDESNFHIEKALKIMQNNVFKDFDLEDAAKLLDLSGSYFVRLFKKKMNITPMKYFTKLRIEAATSLLITTKTPLYKIAERLHFCSEYHFSRVFKQYTGMPPIKYRNAHVQTIGNESKGDS